MSRRKLPIAEDTEVVESSEVEVQPNASAAVQPESCETCKFFMLTEEGNGKGICRANPPRHMFGDGDSPTKDDVRGKRWPVCWQEEWCGKWSKV